MKKHLLLMVFVALVLGACSDSDDKKNESKPEQPALSKKTQVIETPTALAQSGDPVAQQLNGYITSMNQSFSSIASLTVVPDGSSKVTSVGGKGRVTAGASVYYWAYSDPNYGAVNYWYEYINDATYYKWNLYWTSTAMGIINPTKYFSADQKIDGTEGSFTIYDFISNGVANYIYKYKVTGDQWDITWEAPLLDVKQIARQNADKSGFLDYYLEGKLVYKFTWTKTGSGTYAVYNQNGQVVETLTWI